MSGPQADLPATTGKGLLPPIDEQRFRQQWENHEERLSLLEANRTVEVPQLHELANTAPMSQVLAGHAPVLDDVQGAYFPSPVLGILKFHMVGALSVAMSPPQWSRYPTNVIGLSASIESDNLAQQPELQIELNINGDPVLRFQWTSVGTMIHRDVGPFPVGAFNAGRIRVATLNQLSGLSDLIIDVELGSVVAGSVGPRAQSGLAPQS